MNTSGSPRHIFTKILVLLAIVPLLLSACLPGNSPASPTATQPPAATQPVSLPTQAPTEQAASTPVVSTSDFSLVLDGLAQGVTVETVAAVPASTDAPIWEVLPQHRVVTLGGYPVADHLLAAKITIYPLEELAKYNEGAGKIAADLKALLQSRQPGKYMPFLPLFNASQALHPQVQYLDFKNGKGVRFLTQFDQAPLPINNHELIYTFQGLTSDGKYYVSAVLPVTNPGLPADEKVSDQQRSELSDFPAYLDKSTAWLEQQPAASFTPDLAKLDEMIQTLEVK